MLKSPFLRVIVIFLASAGVAVRAQTAKSERDLDSLIAAEQGFSKMSEANGVRTAFLANLAPRGMMLRPQPVLGRPVFENMPPDFPAVLTWRPVVAEVSAAGDMGWTSGPYEIRPGRDYQGAPGGGHYVSVWGREKNGTWKVLLDGGVAHPPPPTAVRPGVDRILAARENEAALSPAELRHERLALLRRDESFSARVDAVGFAGAYLHEGTDDIRLYFESELPVLGEAEVKAKLAESAGSMTLAPASSEVSLSGDLGYTYGSGKMKGLRDQPAEMAFSYLRIWRRAAPQRWRLVVELVVFHSRGS